MPWISPWIKVLSDELSTCQNRIMPSVMTSLAETRHRYPRLICLSSSKDSLWRTMNVMMHAPSKTESLCTLWCWFQCYSPAEMLFISLVNIASCNCLSSVWRPTIRSTEASALLRGPLGTNLIQFESRYKILVNKMHSKIIAAKLLPFCSGLRNRQSQLFGTLDSIYGP